DHLLEADQRVAVPGVGRRVVDGDQRGVAVLFHGELVGQVEDAGLVGFDGCTHSSPRQLSPFSRREREQSSYSSRSSMPPCKSRRRATITRMISLVPSSIWCTRASRTQRSSG